MNEEVSKYMSKIGKKGGQTTAQIHISRGNEHFKLMNKKSLEAKKRKKELEKQSSIDKVD